MPWDNVDKDYILKPRKWDAFSIGRFMKWFGPASSIFDIIMYLILYYIICPYVLGGKYYTLSAAQQTDFMILFNAGWFVESLWTQTIIIHMMRTEKIPFVQSRSSAAVLLFTVLAVILGTILPFTPIVGYLEMTSLPVIYFPWLAVTVISYILLIQVIKKIYINKYGELL